MRANEAYDPAVQRSVSVAGYYRNVDHLGDYKRKSTFLSALNNEVGLGTPLFEKHRDRVEKLHSAMFVMFT